MKWLKQFNRRMTRSLPRFLGVLCVLSTACGSINAATQQIVLGSSWSEHDPFQLGSGVQTLSNQSSTGFTSTHTGSVSDLGDRPRVYQEFTGVDTSQVGQKLSVSFDVQFHDLLTVGDTQFRFGFGDRTTNQGLVPIMIDIGPTAGSSFRMRYDNSISDLPDAQGTVFEPGNYSGFLSASGTFGDGGGNPSGEANGSLGVDTNVTHTFTTTVERVERNVDFSFPPDGIADQVVNGWYTTVTWTNDVTDAEVLFVDTNNAAFAEFDVETGLGVYDEDLNNARGRIENIDTLGFMMFNNQPFLDGVGSFTVSNFLVEYDDGLSVEGDYNGDGNVDAADYTVWRDTLNSTTDLAADGNGNMVIDQADYDVWRTNYGGAGASSVGAQAAPEPGAMFLAMAAGSMFVRRRQRSWLS